jgi:hypothetical protein
MYFFCLPEKVPKKGPAISYAIIAVGSLIKLLSYCGKEQQGLNIFLSVWNDIQLHEMRLSKTALLFGYVLLL